MRRGSIGAVLTVIISLLREKSLKRNNKNNKNKDSIILKSEKDKML
jgi:hypothetical protein